MGYLEEVFLKEFREDCEEFLASGKVSRATELKNTIEKEKEYEVRDDMLPAYFFGDPYAKIVCVNQNAGINQNEKENSETQNIDSYNDIYDSFYNFGEHRYGSKHPKYKLNKKKGNGADGFDVKMLTYMLPFEEVLNYGFDFEEIKGGTEAETQRRTRNDFDNLKKFFAKKCQFEFIPYGSQKFEFRHYKGVEKEYFGRLLKAILAVDRDIVFFNGAGFYNLFQKFKDDTMVLSEIKKVELEKKEKGKTNANYSTCMITYGDKTIKCIINHTITKPGFNGNLPEQYASKIIENEFKNR